MEIRVDGDATKLQLFLLSDEVYEKIKNDSEIRKAILIPPFIKNNKKFEFKGESMKSFPDFSFANEEGCKEILNTIISIYPITRFDGCGGGPIPNENAEKNLTLEGKKYLLLERQCSCGEEGHGGNGYIGITETPEKRTKEMEGNPKLWRDLIDQKKKDISIKYTNLLIGNSSYQDYEVSYKNNIFNEFVFDYDYGCAATLFINSGNQPIFNGLKWKSK